MFRLLLVMTISILFFSSFSFVASAAEIYRAGASVSYGPANTPSRQCKSDYSLHEARVVHVSGTVLCTLPGGDSSFELAAGDPVPEGARIVTGRAHSIVRWEKACITIYPNSSVKINPNSHEIVLSQGHISFGLSKGNSEVYKVRTTEFSSTLGSHGCINAIVGTNFERITSPVGQHYAKPE